MSKLKITIKNNRFIILVSLAALFVAFLPLFTINCINGHDIEYHLLRIEALKEGILAGHPFIKVNMLYFGGRGYASSLFYPDVLLYIPAILRCIGIPINQSYHIFVGVCILLSFVSMYYSVWLIEHDKNAAVIAAIIYTLAQYHIDDIYTRSAAGEYTAMIFLPFLMYGFYELLNARYKKPWIMVIGFWGVILCHTTTTVFVIGLYILGFIISIPKYARDIKKLIPLVLAAIATIGLSCFYWAPVLEQFANASFQTGNGGFDLNYEKLLLKDVFINKNAAFGIAIPVLLFIRLLFSESDHVSKREIRFADACLIFGFLFVLSATGFLPWARLQNILGFVQFPWRLFIVATALFSVSIGIYVSKMEIRKDKLIVVILGIMTISAIGNYSRIDEGYYSYSSDYYSYIPYTANVIGGEWLPKTVTDRDALVKDCDIAVTDKNASLNVNRNGNSLTVKADSKMKYIDVPFIFYKGYRARSVDGKMFLVDGMGTNGMTRVYTDGYNGEIIVDYAGTVLQTFSGIISLVTLIALGLAFYIKKRGHE